MVEGARSAEPPRNQGTALLIASITLPDETRLASPLGSAGKVGIAASHPAGSFPVRNSPSSVAAAASPVRYDSSVDSQARRALLPRSPSVAANRAGTSGGTRKVASAGQP